MTKAERALLEAALYHWITGRFNHLIVAVHKERAKKIFDRVVREESVRVARKRKKR